MKISEGDRQIIVGALDSLGVALADHDHEWTVGERTIYEEAINVLTASPCRMAADSSALTACAASPLANRPHPACAAISTRSHGLGYFLPAITGDPNPSRVCTSYIERANL